MSKNQAGDEESQRDGTADEINLLRPEPVPPPSRPEYVHKKSDMPAVSATLLSGTFVLVKDVYPTGLAVLAELKKQVFGSVKSTGKKHQSDKFRGSEEAKIPESVDPNDFLSYRRKRTVFRHASNKLLVPVKENRIALRKSPDIGWLSELYPDISDFMLTFPQIQGLNSSWQWFLKGVRFPVLKREIFPWYGTYFPTRFDHLHLFNDWLKSYQGHKTDAFDIGTGCGVLSFQLIENGFRQVLATDINPNAIVTVRENARHHGFEDRLEARLSDLFERCDRMADLIVFNPPWLPAESEGDTAHLDKAIYYDPDLFRRFFTDAGGFLKENGRLVVFFSNLGRTSGLEAIHPVEQELAQNRRFKKIRLLRRKVAAPSRKTTRRDHRKKEHVELWELVRV